MARTRKAQRKSGRGAPAGRDGRSARAGERTSAARREAADAELLTMDQAIGLLKTTRATFYRWLRQGKLEGMKVGRQWRFTRAEIHRFLKGEEPRVELTGDVDKLLARLADRYRQLTGREPDDEQQDPLTRAQDLLLRLAVRMRASDIHVEPQARPAPVYGRDDEAGDARVRFRIDGVLHTIAEFDSRLLGPLVDQWRRTAGLDVRQRGRPQDGRILWRSGPEDRPEFSIDSRLCFVPALLGEALTVRLLHKGAPDLALEGLGYAPPDRRRILRALGERWGAVLLSGPTGTGKTTTIYACLNHLIRPEIKAMSVEDPVEYMIPGVVQVALRPEAGLTFEAAIRSFLRSDPDVIMVGEIRSPGILQLCFQAALTGHLILTTLHAAGAVATLRRMADLGAEPFLVSDTVRLIVAQRLVRVLCPECSRPASPPEAILRRAEEAARGSGLNWATLRRRFREAVGCPNCGQTGFRGRTVVAETLELTPEIGKALRSGASDEQLESLAVEQGMTAMIADGLRRAAEGTTTLDEVLRAVARR